MQIVSGEDFQYEELTWTVLELYYNSNNEISSFTAVRYRQDVGYIMMTFNVLNDTQQKAA